MVKGLAHRFRLPQRSGERCIQFSAVLLYNREQRTASAVRCCFPGLLGLLHPPDDGGDLAPGQSVVGLEGAGAVAEVALHDACGIQRLDIGVRGVGEGTDAGQVADAAMPLAHHAAAIWLTASRVMGAFRFTLPDTSPSACARAR